MRDQPRSPQEDFEIEKAVCFLVTSFLASGDNPKPVILHSLRVAFRLYNLGYPKEVVLSAILHDLLEDTAVKAEEIKDKFGSTVLEIVQANSFNREIKDKSQRYQDNFNRCFKQGKQALIVKAADILDNSAFYHLAADEQAYQALINKMAAFITLAEQKIKAEPVFKDLKQKYSELALKQL